MFSKEDRQSYYFDTIFVALQALSVVWPGEDDSRIKLFESNNRHWIETNTNDIKANKNK